MQEQIIIALILKLSTALSNVSRNSSDVNEKRNHVFHEFMP